MSFFPDVGLALIVRNICMSSSDILGEASSSLDEFISEVASFRAFIF